MDITLKDVVVIIPVFNEADTLLSLIKNLSEAGLEKIIFGISPDCTDDTSLILEKEKIPFIVSPKDGYDNAVEASLKKMALVYPQAKVVLFSDVRHNYKYEGIQKFLTGHQ